MLSFLSGKIIGVLEKKQIIDKDEKSIYEYGMELLISAILSFVIMVSIGLITGRLIESFIFYFSFILLRTYTGGYHAKTSLRCKIFFAFAQVVTLFLADIFVRANILYSIISVTICLILIAEYAPIENKNKKINDKTKMKKRAIVTVLILCAVGIFANYLFSKSFATIISTILIVTILIVWDLRIHRALETHINLEHGN